MARVHPVPTLQDLRAGLPAVKFAPSAKGLNSRQCTYPLNLTFWAFLSQIVSPGSSRREVVRNVEAW